MEEVEYNYSQKRDNNNRLIQLLRLLKDGVDSREYYMSLNDAIDIINNDFEFEEGKRYLIKINANYGWRQGVPFNYEHGDDIKRYIYNEATETDLYDEGGLAEKQIHVYGIAVEER